MASLRQFSAMMHILTAVAFFCFIVLFFLNQYGIVPIYMSIIAVISAVVLFIIGLFSSPVPRSRVSNGGNTSIGRNTSRNANGTSRRSLPVAVQHPDGKINLAVPNSNKKNNLAVPNSNKKIRI